MKADIEVPKLPMQLAWLHVCVAVSCDKKTVLAVVNGVKVLDTKFQGTVIVANMENSLMKNVA